jgi:hypothetical protein
MALTNKTEVQPLLLDSHQAARALRGVDSCATALPHDMRTEEAPVALLHEQLAAYRVRPATVLPPPPPLPRRLLSPRQRPHRPPPTPSAVKASSSSPKKEEIGAAPSAGSQRVINTMFNRHGQCLEITPRITNGLRVIANSAIR